jgi:hypothetical protein
VPENAESAAARANAEVVARMGISLLMDCWRMVILSGPSAMPDRTWKNDGGDEK